MMRRALRGTRLALAALGAATAGLLAAPTNAPADFTEVYELVRTHLPGVQPADLEQAAVQGLVTALRPRVMLVSNDVPARASGASPVALARVFEDNVAYLRVAAVEAGLTEALQAAYRQLCATSRPVGVVLDLRFAGGDDYPAAVDAAALFLEGPMAVLDYGEGPVRTPRVAEPLALPVAVLANGQTCGAAEALAAVLRLGRSALILGSPTAGQALRKQAFPLRSGQTLLIATTPVKLADGTALSPQGIKPDIAVAVSPQEEQAYFADAYSLPAPDAGGPGARSGTNSASTNRPARRPRPNEADLIRARREGAPLEAELQAERAPTPPRAVVSDPVLARGLDLLKGLAVVRRARP